ncbi:MAG: HAD-IIIA family hydrolase [Nitrospirota bacterium]
MAGRSRPTRLSPKQLAGRARRIRLLLLDVDGVLTDGRLFYDEHGNSMKSFHIHDGQGLAALRKTGVLIGLISGRASKAVEVRAGELGITIVHQGVDDKRAVYEQLLAAHRLSDERVAYVGDDLPDLPVLARAGLAVAVANAHVDVRRAAHWVTKQPGGAGAVREVADLLLAAKTGKRST